MTGILGANTITKKALDIEYQGLGLFLAEREGFEPPQPTR